MSRLQPIRLLLIEDNADDAIWVQLLLKQTGGICLHWVQTLHAGLQALATEKFDAVLSDLTLPDSKPETTLAVLKDKAVGVALVVLTGRDDRDLAITALRSGAQDYLVKGKYDANSLIRAINYAIERKLLLQKLVNHEEQARQARARLTLASDFSDIGLWSYDVVNGQWDCDEKTLRILGLNSSHPSLWNGIQGCLNHVYPDDRAQVRSRLLSAIITGEPFSLDHRVQLPDGEVRYLVGKAVAFADERGTVHTLTGTAQDITDIKLREQRSRSAALDRQRAQFLAMLAHDLKTPLAASDRVLSALLDDPQGSLVGNTKSILGKLRGSNRALLQMVQNLLDDYQLESGASQLHFERCNLSMVIEACVDEYRAMVADRKLQFEIYIEEGVYASTDPIAIRRVAINLLSNAIKFTPDGGRITISLEQLGDTVRITVIDSGPGIALSAQDRLFKPFSQTENHHRSMGSGLGLHVCRQLVEAHGGTIRCISEPDKGALFEVVLPLPRIEDTAALAAG